MSNKHIAINWAFKQAKAAESFVYSDQFFIPFTEQTQIKITKELRQRGVIAWSDTKGGAFLFRAADKRLVTNADSKTEVGMWVHGGNVMMLPARNKI
jgi:hypothetical protein